ncbi:MAG: VOC family protein [Bacteroidales bacterium]|nr:VOC family protein [Bacteroidales bacterium]
MAKIHHIGLYVTDLDIARDFFQKYFGAESGERYENPRKGFRSYMLTFPEGSRLEVMTREGVDGNKALGQCHISFSVGSKDAVDALTERLRQDGYEVFDGPRTTGDGYYESSIIGIDGNIIEITV